MKKMNNPDNLSEAQLWMLSLSAVLAEQNGIRHDTLLGRKKTHLVLEDNKNALNRDWGITNKSELKKSLNWLLTDGHGVDFLKERHFLSTLPESAQNDYLSKLEKDSSENIQYHLIKNYDKHLPEAGVLAWDYGRYIFLCRNGVLLDYISEKEAWNLMLEVAKLAQKAYSSWREYGLAYIAGRQTWLNKITLDSTEEQIEIVKSLFIDKNSPWNVLDWNIQLD